MCRSHEPRSVEAWAESEEAMFAGLNSRQARFVMEYCGSANANATQAAELAGYGGKNTTRASLQSHGSKLLNTPKVKAAILKRYDELSATSEEILTRMTADARIDIAPLVEVVEAHSAVKGKNGEPDTPAVKAGVYLRLTPKVLRKYGTLIKELEIDPMSGRVIKVKLNDSQAARRDLAKIRRLFTDGPTVNLFQLGELSDEQLTERLEATRVRLRGPGGTRHEEDTPTSSNGRNGRRRSARRSRSN